jgi:excisionase family DNA binding protein
MIVALSIKDAAKRLSISRSRLYELLSTGLIAARKIGRRTVILESEISRFLESCPVAPPGGRVTPTAVGPIPTEQTSPAAHSRPGY